MLITIKTTITNTFITQKSDEPFVFANVAVVLTNITIVLADVSIIFANIAFVFTDIAELLSYESFVLAIVTIIRTNIAFILALIPIIRAQITSLFTSLTKVLSFISILLAFERYPVTGSARRERHLFTILPAIFARLTWRRTNECGRPNERLTDLARLLAHVASVLADEPFVFTLESTVHAIVAYLFAHFA